MKEASVLGKRKLLELCKQVCPGEILSPEAEDVSLDCTGIKP